MAAAQHLGRDRDTEEVYPVKMHGPPWHSQETPQSGQECRVTEGNRRRVKQDACQTCRIGQARNRLIELPGCTRCSVQEKEE